MADKVVYSTDPDWGKKGTPRQAGLPIAPLKAGTAGLAPRQPEPVRLVFARNAKGSGVTRVERLIMHPTLKDQLLSQLKKRLGCGGAVKDGILELQGDHRDALEKELVAQGYKVRRVG